jgi:Fe-S cluster assembly ATP-binding protein
LEYIIPDKVHILMAGKIISSGGQELADQVEQSGYSFALNESRE